MNECIFFRSSLRETFRTRTPPRRHGRDARSRDSIAGIVKEKFFARVRRFSARRRRRRRRRRVRARTD